VQNIQTNNFGALTPSFSSPILGAFTAAPEAQASTDAHGEKVWVGCVTSSGQLVSVVAQGIQNMSTGGGAVLPLANVAIGISNKPGGNASPQCQIAAGQSQAGSCTLPDDGATVRSLAGETPPGTTEIDWQYQLDLPANQKSGVYGGGEIIFTATANAPESAAEICGHRSSEKVSYVPATGATAKTEPTGSYCVLEPYLIVYPKASHKMGNILVSGKCPQGTGIKASRRPLTAPRLPRGVNSRRPPGSPRIRATRGRETQLGARIG